MAEETSLVQRFAFGSNDISMYMPGTPRHAFFVGMPQRDGLLVLPSRSVGAGGDEGQSMKDEKRSVVEYGV